jgi:hypothetical protein
MYFSNEENTNKITMFENVENCKLLKEKIGRSWTPYIHFHPHNITAL